MITKEKCTGCPHFTTRTFRIDEKYNMIFGHKLHCKVGEENCNKEQSK